MRLPRFTFGLLPLVIITLSSCSDTTAPAKIGILEVTVVDALLNPIIGAEIKIEPYDSPDQSWLTDIAGKVRIEGIAAGVCSLDVESRDYARHSSSVTIETDEVTEHVVSLTWLPGSLSVYVREIGSNDIIRDGLVLVMRSDNGAELFSGLTNDQGTINITSLPIADVLVTVDSTSTMATAPVEVAIKPNQTINVDMWSHRFASLVVGNIEFKTGQEHRVRLFQVQSDGSNMQYISEPKFFAGPYSMTTQLRTRIGVIAFGNGSSEEFSAVVSPYINGVSEYVTYSVPKLEGWMLNVSPINEISLLKSDMPLTLSCDYPSAATVYVEWQVYHWWQDEQDNWNYELLWYQPNYSAVKTATWNDPSAPASSTGELYSWVIITSHATGVIKFGNDNYFRLVESGGVSTSVEGPHYLSNKAREALKNKAIESFTDRFGNIFTRILPK